MLVVLNKAENLKKVILIGSPYFGMVGSITHALPGLTRLMFSNGEGMWFNTADLTNPETDHVAIKKGN